MDPVRPQKLPTKRISRVDADEKLVRGAERSVDTKPKDSHSDRVRRELVRRAGEGLLRNGKDATHPIYNRRAIIIKRMLDVVGSVFGIVVLAPVWITVAILVKLTSRGPVFFSQYRMGLNGNWVRTLKFRTMVVDADDKLKEVLAADPDLRKEYEQFHKMEKDPRITPIGSFLRRHSLDELPQLLSVFTGQTSLVGPRGYLAFEVMKMPDTERLIQIVQVKPGLTGFWQVGGRSNVPFDERLDMEVFYIQNWSLGMDAYLLINTVWILLVGRGAGAS